MRRPDCRSLTRKNAMECRVALAGGGEQADVSGKLSLQDTSAISDRVLRISNDDDAVPCEDETTYVPFDQRQRGSSRFSARTYAPVTVGEGSGQGCADSRTWRGGRVAAGSGGSSRSVADRLHARGCRGGPVGLAAGHAELDAHARLCHA